MYNDKTDAEVKVVGVSVSQRPATPQVFTIAGAGTRCGEPSYTLSRTCAGSSLPRINVDEFRPLWEGPLHEGICVVAVRVRSRPAVDAHGTLVLTLQTECRDPEPADGPCAGLTDKDPRPSADRPVPVRWTDSSWILRACAAPSGGTPEEECTPLDGNPDENSGGEPSASPEPPPTADASPTADVSQSAGTSSEPSAPDGS
ncbi:hypothetical protein ACQPYK_02930 [Streptosporangium sp. CA-135522]|uniref:hypothetical protein n=1 Tax=Streptosporangium sp. CA-135522 TaxID=3240072 RepID=UPI003D8D583A